MATIRGGPTIIGQKDTAKPTSTPTSPPSGSDISSKLPETPIIIAGVIVFCLSVGAAFVIWYVRKRKSRDANMKTNGTDMLPRAIMIQNVPPPLEAHAPPAYDDVQAGSEPVLMPPPPAMGGLAQPFVIVNPPAGMTAVGPPPVVDEEPILPVIAALGERDGGGGGVRVESDVVRPLVVGRTEVVGMAPVPEVENVVTVVRTKNWIEEVEGGR
ncbi:hypothetical protein HDU97_003329 [Phlyctochytrium planicorne]|nr:hypothetical protein HDU97_003329 [Phlyctochytrium planicorne]